MNSAQIELLNQYLDGRLPEGELDALQALLRENATARRMLRDLATIDTRLTELASAPADVAPPMPITATKPASRTGKPMWRTLSGLALGLLIGVVSSTVAFAYVPQWLVIQPTQHLILREGFESSMPPSVSGLPVTAGVWSGDFSAITGPQQGIAPTGAKMLQFLRADYDGKANADDSYCGDLFRLVDMRPYQRELAAGSAVLEVSAAFNAYAFPLDEEYRGTLALHALTAELAANPTTLSGAMLANNSLAMARQSCPRMDRDPLTWQRVESTMQLPAETEFVLIHIGMNHIPKYQRRVAFDGHYLDDVKLTLTRRK